MHVCTDCWSDNNGPTMVDHRRAATFIACLLLSLAAGFSNAGECLYSIAFPSLRYWAQHQVLSKARPAIDDWLFSCWMKQCRRDKFYQLKHLEAFNCVVARSWTVTGRPVNVVPFRRVLACQPYRNYTTPMNDFLSYVQSRTRSHGTNPSEAADEVIRL